VTVIPEQAIFQPVTEYNRNISSQCNLPTQINPVQDKSVDVINTPFKYKQCRCIVKSVSTGYL
jgi:hypothetical protein